jgi:outer membrane protein OmpA-like peptidoglycan-associated protein
MRLPADGSRSRSLSGSNGRPAAPAARTAGAALLAAVLLAWAPAGHAQAATDTTLLRGQQVTESNLLDALTPPGALPEGTKTRSLRIGRDGAGVASPRPTGKAALLITFVTDSADLTPTARQQLDIVAAAMRNDRLASYRFTVEGHADPRGTPEGNLVLSQRRADAVRDYLVSTHRIDAARLMTEGKGQAEPLNRERPAAPENRRVTFVTIPN